MASGISACMPIALRLVGDAIGKDSQNCLKEAYCQYLSCCIYISQILKDDAWDKDLHVVYNNDTVKLFKLIQQCQERALSIITSQTSRSFSPPNSPRLDARKVNNSQPSTGNSTLQPPQQPARKLSDPMPPRATQDSNQSWRGHARNNSAGSIPTGQSQARSLKFPSPPSSPPMHGMRRATISGPGAEIGPRNQQPLITAYRARMDQGSPRGTMRVTNRETVTKNLSLMRKMAENQQIARAREEAIKRKIMERQLRLQEETNRRFHSSTVASRDEQEHRILYTRILEYEQDMVWPKQLRENLRMNTENSRLINEIIKKIFSSKDHPLTLYLTHYQYVVYQKLIPLVRDSRFEPVKGMNICNKPAYIGNDDEVKYNEAASAGEVRSGVESVPGGDLVENPGSEKQGDEEQGTGQPNEERQSVNDPIRQTGRESSGESCFGGEEQQTSFASLKGEENEMNNEDIRDSGKSDLKRDNRKDVKDNGEEEGKIEMVMEEKDGVPDSAERNEGGKDAEESSTNESDAILTLNNDSMCTVSDNAEGPEQREVQLDSNTEEGNDSVTQKNRVMPVENTNELDNSHNVLDGAETTEKCESNVEIVTDDNNLDNDKCVNQTAEQSKESVCVAESQEEKIGNVDQDGYNERHSSEEDLESKDEVCKPKEYATTGNTEGGMVSGEENNTDMDRENSALDEEVTNNAKSDENLDRSNEKSHDDSVNEQEGSETQKETEENDNKVIVDLESDFLELEQDMLGWESSDEEEDIVPNEENKTARDDAQEGLAVDVNEHEVTDGNAEEGGEEEEKKLSIGSEKATIRSSNSSPSETRLADSDGFSRDGAEDDEDSQNISPSDGNEGEEKEKEENVIRQEQSEKTLDLMPEVSLEETKNHLKDIFVDIRFFLEKLQKLLILAYEELDTPTGHDQCYASVEYLFFRPLWSLLLAVLRRVNYEKEMTLGCVMTARINDSPAGMCVTERLCLTDKVALQATGNQYPYQMAVDELHRVATYVCPLEKLECLVRTSRDICQCVEDYWECKGKPRHCSETSIGCDDLLPILSFVIIRSGMAQLISECHAMEEFIPEGYLMGEEGYCLTTLQTALAYLATLEDNTK